MNTLNERHDNIVHTADFYNKNASFNRLRTANPATQEFIDAYHLANQYNPQRAGHILKRRWKKVRGSKEWLAYKKFQKNGTIPQNLQWISRLENFVKGNAVIAAENFARKVTKTIDLSSD